MTTINPGKGVHIKVGHTLLLDDQMLHGGNCLSVSKGLVRVGMSNPDQEALEAQPITLGFLQTGDHLPLELLRNNRLHLQALSATQLDSTGPSLPPAGASSLTDWTVALLCIRHLGEAEHRIAALLTLLVQRLGCRKGDWYELPLRLTHADLAELSGHTRVTITKQLSRWRESGLIQLDRGSNSPMRLAPDLIEARTR